MVTPFIERIYSDHCKLILQQTDIIKTHGFSRKKC